MTITWLVLGVLLGLVCLAVTGAVVAVVVVLIVQANRKKPLDNRPREREGPHAG